MRLFADCRHEVHAPYEDFCFECWLLNSCMRSGVPRYVTDPIAIAQVAALMGAGKG